MRRLPFYGILETERQVNTMRCPYCETDMTKGFLKSAHVLFFTLDREDSGLEDTSFCVNADGFPDRFLHGSSLPAHYCPACRIFLASRPDPVSDPEKVPFFQRAIQKLKKEDF